MLPRPLIVGLPGPTLDAALARDLAALAPLGVILFARNIESPEQVRELTRAVRAALGRADAPVLIDQEGGRVARLKAPHFRHPPAAGRIGALWERDRKLAARVAFLNGYLIGRQVAALGIDVNCAPVCDLRIGGRHEVVGDRGFHAAPAVVAALAAATARGQLAAGVQPVIKHAPGHGRAQVDSHLEMPVVDADQASLLREAHPFRHAARVAPWAMTAHVLYPALDPGRCASHSPAILRGVVRRLLGCHGVLVTDDLRMKALGGPIEADAAAALAAGCDIALDCAPGPQDWPRLAGLPAMRPATWRRLLRARRRAARAWRPLDLVAAEAIVGAALAEP